MNGRKARAMRKAVKSKGIDIFGKDYRVAKEVSKIMYSTNALGVSEAKTIKRITIANASKAGYNQFKKVFNSMKKSDRFLIKE